MFDSRPLSRVLVIAAAIVCARPGSGAPALTPIQDVLYKADGTRFNGTLYITWSNFQSGDSSMIATQAVTIQVVNGALQTQLVPTTNASAGANYSVRYVSQGKFQFSELWAVPPSASALRVRDVRVSAGSVVGPPPSVTSPILISDVTGLANELNLRASKGTGFAPGRTAVINTSGLVDGAVGSASDCVRVDGSSGPCGSGGGMFPGFADAENPSGVVDGSNTTFTLLNTPSPAASLALYNNGVLQRQALDYTLNNAAILFVRAAAPQPGDVITAYYRYADPTNPLSTLAPAQVICSSTGQTTGNTAITSLGSCTIPANFLNTGDRIEIRYDFAHSGTSSAFSTQVTWGASTISTRGGIASEAGLSGRGGLGISAAGSQWNSENWGASTAYAIATGIAPDALSSPIPILFRAQLTTAGSDTVALRNFTVVRYPAQSNP